MARKTYSEIRSLAIKYAKEQATEVYVLIYKDAGGNYVFKAINRPGMFISYTELKAIVHYVPLKNKDGLELYVSRETIGYHLEALEVNLIYCKFV